MLRELRIYFHYFVVFLKSKAVYKFDFAMGLFANLLVALFGVLFIVLLIDGDLVTALGDWSRDEVLFIYGYSMLAFSLFNAVAFNLYRFGEKYVNEGQFDRVLTRPVSSIPQVLFESFNLDSIGTFLLGCFLLFHTSSELRLQLEALDFLWLGMSAVSGACILISVFVILASLSFHVDDKLGIGAPVYSLISFGRYPVTIFNQVIQFVLSFVVPFAFVAFYPATHFFSHQGFELYCYGTPLVAIVMCLLAGVCWRSGVRKYASTGF